MAAPCEVTRKMAAANVNVYFKYKYVYRINIGVSVCNQCGYANEDAAPLQRQDRGREAGRESGFRSTRADMTLDPGHARPRPFVGRARAARRRRDALT